jgi:acid phosphatase family membrane protein YuiD
MKILLLPLAAGIIAQVAKFFVKSNHLKFSWRHWRIITSYSGMPSSHTAITVALVAIVFLVEGISSTFVVALVLMILTIRDAVGLRSQIGKQGEVINELVEDLDEDRLLDEKYPHLAEKIGHSKRQVMVGAIIGLLVSWIGFYLF